MTIKFQAKHKIAGIVDGPLHPFQFPGGEQHIKVDENTDFDDYAYFIADVRGADANEYVLAAMWAQVVRSEGGKVVLVVPYLPAARADRGVPNLTPYVSLIFEATPDQLIYLDPHSSAWVDQYNDWDGLNIMTEFPFERIIQREVQAAQEGLTTYAGVIAPDKGAHGRAARAAKVMGVPVYHAEKTRDFETGKLTGFHMVDALPEEGKFLLVDDICDGGGTFAGLAQAIGIGRDRLDLWVTHGIFSNEHTLHQMTEEYFGVIHTTNSYPTRIFQNPKPAIARRLGTQIKVHNIEPYMIEAINV
jgi:phosphoribosylpyrophosphate synthetase